MAVSGFACKNADISNVCQFQKRYDGTVYEIEAFIELFPGKPMSRATYEYNKQWERQRELDRWHATGRPRGCSMCPRL